MRKYFILLSISLIICPVFPQQPGKSYLDSLYQKLVDIRSGSMEGLKNISSHPDTAVIKCGFELINQAKINFRYFNEQQRDVLARILQRPADDTSFVSSGGFFRIHFLKSNFPDYVPNDIRITLTPEQLSAYKKLYLDSLAIALDSAYNFEVNFLGYPSPPGDSIVNTPPSQFGGDNKYDIYITNLGSNLYGYTEFETEVSPGSDRYTSYMVIDDDYPTFYTTRIQAARVTVAHEFHHAIQAGDYIYRDSDSFFYELTSTSMEHFVFETIYDYYQYLPNYFRHPDRTFGANNGYNLPIWNFFLKDKYGYGIIKRQWQLMPQMRALQAVNTSLTEHNSTFGRELNEFGIWTYFTGFRTYVGKYFKEASEYPLITPLSQVDFSNPQMTISLNVKPLSNNFIRVYLPAPLNDTLTAIITNANVAAGIDTQSIFYPISYILSTQSSDGSIKILDNYYEKLVSENPSNYFDSEIYKDQVIKEDTSIFKLAVGSINYTLPNPFNYSVNYPSGQYIFFPVKIPNAQKADINIYSVSMNLVYSGTLTSELSGNTDYNFLRWNVMDSKNRRLSSGVYFYLIKYGDQTFKGKFVVFQ